MALKPNAGLIAPVPGVPQTEPPKFNLGDLFCAKPPRPVARLIGAVGPSERTVGRSAGVHIAARLRFRRSDRRRCLRGSSGRYGSAGLAGAASAGGTIGAPIVALGTEGEAWAAGACKAGAGAAARPAAVSTMGGIGAGSRSSPSNTLPRAITSTAP